jgi:hypothetical protein
LHQSDKLIKILANQFVIQGLRLEQDQLIKEFREEEKEYHQCTWGSL